MRLDEKRGMVARSQVEAEGTFANRAHRRREIRRPAFPQPIGTIGSRH
jgi:hypothetical protein